MDIAIRGRNIEVSDALRSTVEEKVTRLGRHLDGVERAEVSFREERNPRIAEREVCEVTMVGQGRTLRAKASAADNRAAVDKVIEKLEHRLEKVKGRRVNRFHPRRNSNDGSRVPDEAVADEAAEAGSRVIRTRRVDSKPMTPEEAVLQMDLQGQDFVLFTNSETDRAAVVYRRQDGYAGLIDAC